MGFLDSISSFVFEAATGTVSPQRLAQIKAETDAAIRKAAGNNTVLANQQIAQSHYEIESDLRRQGKHPDEAGLRFGPLGSGTEFLKNLQNGIYATVLVGAVASVVYFGRQFWRHRK